MENMKKLANKWIVVTTINKPTEAISVISKLCKEGWNAVVVGDTKTPADWHAEGVHFLSVGQQKEMFGDLCELIPYRHYSRKNLGYLYAMAHGAEIILETDDDNVPYPEFGKNIHRKIKGRKLQANGWANVYKAFTSANIWPRGLPLDEIHTSGVIVQDETEYWCPIQQYLADEDPDVDAIYRLIFKNSLVFDKSSPVILEEGVWTPFNSQNTLFFSEVFSMLYLPCHVSFRMTDIWRSFVCNAALWIHGYKLGFQEATVAQYRNEHDLMKDFQDEIIGYTDNRKIAQILDRTRQTLSASNNMTDTVFALWQDLARENVIPQKELIIIDAWLKIYQKLVQV